MASRYWIESSNILEQGGLQVFEVFTEPSTRESQISMWIMLSM